MFILTDIIKIGGKCIPTPVKPKKNGGKVYRMGDNMYSVHTNQVYRTICHVPPGMSLADFASC